MTGPTILARSPPLLAVLVNESRARRPDLSGDRFARAWIPSRLQGQVEALWREYAETVYPHDDIVVSVRNRFFLGLIEEHPAVGQALQCLLAPGGLTSYPYLAKPGPSFIEIDLPEVIGYKRARCRSLIERGILPDRDVAWQPLDLERPEAASVISSLFHSDSARLIVLEGISYYLEPQCWWKLVQGLAARLRPGDVMAFDFWNTRYREAEVYGRYLAFCRKHGGYRAGGFSFIGEDQIRRAFPACAVEIAPVTVWEARLFGTRTLDPAAILNDTYAVVRF